MLVCQPSIWWLETTHFIAVTRHDGVVRPQNPSTRSQAPCCSRPLSGRERVGRLASLLICHGWTAREALTPLLHFVRFVMRLQPHAAMSKILTHYDLTVSGFLRRDVSVPPAFQQNPSENSPFYLKFSQMKINVSTVSWTRSFHCHNWWLSQLRHSPQMMFVRWIHYEPRTRWNFKCLGCNQNAQWVTAWSSEYSRLEPWGSSSYLPAGVILHGAEMKSRRRWSLWRVPELWISQYIKKDQRILWLRTS